MGLAIPGWRRKPEEETMKNQLILAFLSIAMAGCAAYPDAAATQKASDTVVASATLTVTAAQIMPFHPTRIFTRTPSQTPAITPAQTVYDILEPMAQDMYGMSAKPLLDFFFALQSNVRTEDKEQLAGMVLYPIAVYGANGAKVVVRSEKAFAAMYSQFATKEWKKAILDQDPAELFMNWQGVMVGRGELWFSPACIGRDPCTEGIFIIAIN
jgi:hypothetical protein